MPIAKETEAAVLRAAARAIQRQEKLRRAQHALDAHLCTLSRQCDAIAGTRGTSPDGLRRVCLMGGLL